MKIAIACDHGGYLLKQDILIWLERTTSTTRISGATPPRAWTIPYSLKGPPGRWPPGNATRAS